MPILFRISQPSSRAALVLLLMAASATPAFAEAGLGTSPAKIAAATQTAQQGASCRAIGDFYWEIGDGTGPLASGTIGSDYSATTSVKIASASKFVWGAYVLERLGKGREPDANQLSLLEMQSGHTSFNPIACLFSRTVGSCLTARSNAEVKPEDVGRFSYSGGHDQQMAVNFGLGGYTAEQMTQEVRRYIGTDIGLSYARPQPAGGMEGTPADYAKFLRKIISGQLRIRDYLGKYPVCTLPGSCPNAVSSPVKEAWHYSINHWVEDAPGTGDGSFSSPGLEGFYPWISADKTLYGVLARQQLRANAYWESVLCGRNIRRAFVTATPVLQ
jgi:hypothetical protein